MRIFGLWPQTRQGRGPGNALSSPQCPAPPGGLSALFGSEGLQRATSPVAQSLDMCPDLPISHLTAGPETVKQAQGLDRCLSQARALPHVTPRAAHSHQLTTPGGQQRSWMPQRDRCSPSTQPMELQLCPDSTIISCYSLLSKSRTSPVNLAQTCGEGSPWSESL